MFISSSFFHRLLIYMYSSPARSNRTIAIVAMNSM